MAGGSAGAGATGTGGSGGSSVVCGEDAADCNGISSDGCEQDISGSASNCGGCERSCSTASALATECLAGVCTPQCDDGFADCDTPATTEPDDGCETNLNTSGSNCGGCGKSCLGGACISGVCQPVLISQLNETPTSIAVTSNYLYWSTVSKVSRVPLTGGTPSTVADNTSVLSIVVEEGTLYWIDGNGAIWRQPAGGSATQISAVSTISFDVEGPWLVYSGSSTYRIPTTGGTPVEFSTGQTTAVVIDGSNIYYSGNNIRRTALVGSSSGLVANTGEPTHSIAVDATHVYWKNLEGDIYSAPKTGGATPKQLVSQGPSSPVIPIGLEVDDTHVYAAGSDLIRVPKDGSDVEQVLDGDALDVAVDDDAVYWVDANNNRVMKLAK